jgi:hypothetical protein
MPWSVNCRRYRQTMPPEQLTLDMTAIRDVLHADRKRHQDGLALLALAERGAVELGVPPQGTLADLRGQWEGDLAADLRNLARLPGVVALPQLARLSEVTFPSDNLYPGYYVGGFDRAWDQVATTWKTHQGSCPGAVDRWYVESHIAAKRNVLLTNDRALQVMCDRLRTKHQLPVQAEGLTEYIARRAHRR